jgi:hypothetical protein
MLKFLKTVVVVEDATIEEVVAEDATITVVVVKDEAAVKDVVVQEVKNEVLDQILETEVKEDDLIVAQNQGVLAVQIPNLRHQVLTDQDVQEDNL